MDSIMAESEPEEEGDLNIARRTRSHLRMDDFVLNDKLDFPDVEMDLYQNPDSEVDTEYKKFLNQCYSREEGWRYDLNELHQNYKDYMRSDASCSSDFNNQANIRDNDTLQSMSNLSAVPISTSSQINKPRRKIDMFADPEFARILDQQLRQHIQLLTQAFLLTKNTTNMRNEAEEAKSHLDYYMMIFKNKKKPSNLLPALDLVNNLATPKDIKSSIRLSWRPLPIPEPVKQIIHDNPNVFIYPSLMPQVAFSILPEKLLPKKPKINFTLNEDKLLAYALNEFKGETSPYAFIASLLMTAKTKTQISNHIKNIKRSSGNEDNPIKLYFSQGLMPNIDLDSDADLVEVNQEVEIEEVVREPEELKSDINTLSLKEDDDDKDCEHVILIQKEQEEEQKTPAIIDKNDREDEGEQTFQPLPICDSQNIFRTDHDDLMNMDLDDLMAASTTISKSAMINPNNNSTENNKNLKNLKLKKSMLNLMSHNFLLSKDMGDLIIYEFLKSAQEKLGERNNIHLLQLLSNLTTEKDLDDSEDKKVVKIYQEISDFLQKVEAPAELLDKVVLLLDFDQATKCGCSSSYLHWMRFFQFMQHVELYHDGVETLEKKLIRLIDALQKDDPHKIKLAIGNLVNKHPFLKREFESLSLEEKPHPSLFICEEDFDDITEPISTVGTSGDNLSNIYDYEHFNPKISKEELSFASQSCPCKCHSESNTSDGQLSQHCGQCNLKFMKGRMYLVSKIKPILAEWNYTEKTPGAKGADGVVEWTFEEDREILEFCRSKAEQNEETISFDAPIFEELVSKRKIDNIHDTSHKKSARDIAERFNQLMDLYKDENSNNIQ